MKVCFIITSVISPSERPLSYSAIRSTFSSEERFQQTINTVLSIREYIPNSKIILIEGGYSIPKLNRLKEIVDKYIFLGRSKLIRIAVDSRYKGLGEATILLVSRIFWRNNFDLYFKISGRYTINASFDISKWNSKDKIMGKVLYDGVELSTRLVGIPKKRLNGFFFVLIISIYKLLKNGNLEGLLTKYIGVKNIEHINTLGVSGYIAPNGKPIIE